MKTEIKLSIEISKLFESSIGFHVGKRSIKVGFYGKNVGGWSNFWNCVTGYEILYRFHLWRFFVAYEKITRERSNWHKFF